MVYSLFWAEFCHRFMQLIKAKSFAKSHISPMSGAPPMIAEYNDTDYDNGEDGNCDKNESAHFSGLQTWTRLMDSRNRGHSGSFQGDSEMGATPYNPDSRDAVIKSKDSDANGRYQAFGGQSFRVYTPYRVMPSLLPCLMRCIHLSWPACPVYGWCECESNRNFAAMQLQYTLTNATLVFMKDGHIIFPVIFPNMVWFNQHLPWLGQHS